MCCCMLFKSYFRLNMFAASGPSSRCWLSSGWRENPAHQRINQVLIKMRALNLMLAYLILETFAYDDVFFFFIFMCRLFEPMSHVSVVSPLRQTSVRFLCLCFPFLLREMCLWFMRSSFSGTLWWRSCLSRTTRRRAWPLWCSMLWSR